MSATLPQLDSAALASFSTFGIGQPAGSEARQQPFDVEAASIFTGGDTAPVVGGRRDERPVVRTRSESSVGSAAERRKSTGDQALFGKRKAAKKHKKAAGSLSILSAQGDGGLEPRWNVFRSIPRDKDVFDPQWTIITAQVVKVAVYIVLHLLVFVGGLVAKSTLLLITSNLRSPTSYVPCRPFGADQVLIPQDALPVPPYSVTWFYWVLWLAMCVPEALTLLRGLRIVLFRDVPTPSIFVFFAAFVIESLHTVGLCLLVFVVLPDLDAVRAAMLLSAVGSLPAFLSMLTNAGRCSHQSEASLHAVSDAIALVCQVNALWLWPLLDGAFRFPLLVPVALVLTSLSWWENYVSKSAAWSAVASLGRLKERLQRSRYKSHVLLAPWKCVLAFFCMVLSGGVTHPVRRLFDFGTPFANATHMADDEAAAARLAHTHQVLWLLFWLAVTSFVCYSAAKFALRVRMDRFSYAIPVISVLPACIVLMLVLCETKREEPCYFARWLDDRVFWNCAYGSVRSLISDRLGWAIILWFSSYLWLAFHMFTQKPGRLSKTDTLFVMPGYDGLLVDQSLALNRRRHAVNRVRTRDLREDAEGGDDESMATEGTDLSLMYSLTSLSLANSSADTISKIYVCATMWHETLNEMKQMFKSIVRLDEDQSARRNAQRYLKVVDPDYYEMEAHIFFDDAWQDDERLGARVPNHFVRLFASVVDDSVSEVHKVRTQVKPPAKFDTPYGGRLVYTLPGDNRLFVHLKDKQKVRNKKRWSQVRPVCVGSARGETCQVMYMYYLLGHRIMELIADVSRKQLLADNTYILAIDGDSKFSPAAVQKLVDLMKKQSRIASACGRIHPIGNGIIVWYQKFEYAIAHWFQKAAEHVFGCVLCSPGCFSLFRGSALMDDNVMNKYTKLPTDARHFVQYDQGEDRWLSTLLLKQGYRIEYAAASDAETYAPEEFDEFFNQRRRWTPSSIANTLDLLADYKARRRSLVHATVALQRVVDNNDSISLPYIAYQTVVILFSMLGPGIIFTMMIFAQVAAFHADGWTILWTNLAPLLVFIVLCLIAGSKTQLAVAKLLSIAYTFVMMAVVVGTGIQMSTEGFASPTSIFITTMVSVFFFAAFFHPREFICIIYGAIFFLMIPSTYVLMSLYSLLNLNVINWGTREAAQKAAGKDVSLTKLQQWAARLRAVTTRVRPDGADDDERRGQSPCADLCGCCGGGDPRAASAKDEQLRWVDRRLDHVDRRLDRLDERLDGRVARLSLHATAAPVLSADDAADASTEPPRITVTRSSPPSAAAASAAGATPPEQRLIDAAAYVDRRDSLSSLASLNDSFTRDLVQEGASNKPRVPVWMNQKEWGAGTNDVLDELEHQFWTDFIVDYLKPIKKSAEEEASEVVALKQLRDKIAFALLLINGLLVLTIYLLQKNKELLSFRFVPYDNYTWNKYFPDKGKYEVVQEPLLIEPIGLIIIGFLSLILGVQTLGLCLHRFHTFSHVLSSTVLSCLQRRRPTDDTGDDILDGNAVEIARNMQKLNDDGEVAPAGDATARKRATRRRRRKIIQRLEKARSLRQRNRGLHAAFQRRFFQHDADSHRDSLRGVRLEHGSALFQSAAAQQVAAEAIVRRRELVRSTERNALPAVSRQPDAPLERQRLRFDERPHDSLEQLDDDAPQNAVSFLDDMRSSLANP